MGIWKRVKVEVTYNTSRKFSPGAISVVASGTQVHVEDILSPSEYERIKSAYLGSTEYEQGKPKTMVASIMQTGGNNVRLGAIDRVRTANRNSWRRTLRAQRKYKERRESHRRRKEAKHE